MKLLKIKAINGFKMLANNFEINFLTKTRIDKENICEKDLLQIQDDFYYPLQTILIGKNSSGKTTTLELISCISNFINTGRMPIQFFKEQSIFETEFVYFDDGKVYKYHGVFERNDILSKEFLIIKDEELHYGVLRDSTKKDLSNLSYYNDNLIAPNVGGDTSGISKNRSGIDFSIVVDSISWDPLTLEAMVKILNNIYKCDILTAITRLFDDSIERLSFFYNETNNPVGYIFKRVNKSELIIDLNYLPRIISSGTYRGIFLFASSIIAFNFGGHIMVDEIEKSFNKNFIENILMLFADKRINKKGATIIYSTHYSELLDGTNRCDNINVLHRKDDVITLSNLSNGYDLRTDVLKSKQFDQNAFDNILNYECFMKLRKELLK